MREVLQYCNASSKLLGYEVQDSTLTLDGSLESSPWKQVRWQYRAIQRQSPTDDALSAFLQLTKIIVSLTANNLLISSYDEALQDLVEVLQEVDPMDLFLHLIVAHDLELILEKIMRLRHPTLEIFMEKVFRHCAALGSCELVHLLLEMKRSMDALGAIAWTNEAFRVATVHGHDLGLVRYLLDVGADPYAHYYSDHSNLLKNAWIKSDVALIRSPLDAMILRYKSENRRVWYKIIRCMCRAEVELYKMVLNYYTELTGPEFRSECRLLIDITLSKERQALMKVVSREQSWEDRFLAEPLCLNIFQHLCKEAAGRAGVEFLRCLTDLESGILYALRDCDEDACLTLLLSLDSNSDMYQSRSIFQHALRYKWMEVANLMLRNNENKEQLIGYFVDFICECRHLNDPMCQILQDEEMLDGILSHSSMQDTRTLIYWLTWAISTEKLWLIKHFFHSHKTRGPAEELFGRPKFVYCALKKGNAETFQWLLSFKSFLDSINELLDSEPNDIFWTTDNDSGFRYPASVLKGMFNSGLSPTRSLLLLICVSCSEYKTENMHAIIDWRCSLGKPFSKADMSYCLNHIIELRERDLIFDCHTHNRNEAFHTDFPCRLSCLRFLHDCGAIAKDPWINSVLESTSKDGNMLLRVFFDSRTSPVHTAIMCLDITVLESLFALGYSPHEYYRSWEEHYSIPIQGAAAFGKHSVIEMLLQRGANINALPSDQYGKTALQIVAEYGNLQLAVDLLRAGADMNAPAAKLLGMTALEGAASMGHLDLVHVLITNNKNIFLLRKDYKRASRFAKRSGHRVISRMLDEHARTLAQQLGVEHEDEIDKICDCEIQRQGYCDHEPRRVFHVEMCKDCVMELCDEFEKKH